MKIVLERRKLRVLIQERARGAAKKVKYRTCKYVAWRVVELRVHS
jgi:hypothetical protein